MSAGTSLLRITDPARRISYMSSGRSARAVLISFSLLLVSGIFLLSSTPLRYPPSIDWSSSTHLGIAASHQHYSDDQMRNDFAYSLYVTEPEYLCNAVMILDSLQAVGVRASRLLMFPDLWVSRERSESLTSTLFVKARDLGALLRPVAIQTSLEGDPTWRDSYTKLLAFNQTQFKRIISLDADATVLQSLDEIFFQSATPIAAPLAYWMEKRTLSSQILLIDTTHREFASIMHQIHFHKDGEFDMEIINNLYSNSASTIPHRPYDLLSGEFRSKNHTPYLGSSDLAWNATNELANAKFVHFSDWPVPKPWAAPAEQLEKNKPPCVAEGDGLPEDCSNRDAWLWLYHDFMARRKRVCGLDWL